jgi:hypothetical protein
VIGVVGLVIAWRTVGGQRATLCALSQQVPCRASHGELRTDEFLPAFERAAAAGRAAVIELRTDPDRLTTHGQVRRAARPA